MIGGHCFLAILFDNLKHTSEELSLSNISVLLNELVIFIRCSILLNHF